MPVQVNATLTAVAQPGATTGDRDDWDTPGTTTETGAGAVKWQADPGIAPNAYYRETLDRAQVGGDLNVTTRQVLYIDTALARLINVDTDDVLTFTDPAGVTRTAQASNVALRELDVAPQVSSTRVDLQPLAAPNEGQ